MGSVDLSAGALARAGLLEPEAITRAEEVVRQVARDELETVRLVFPDQHGTLRGKTVVADALASTFASGLTVPSTTLFKDTSQRTVFPVWQADASFGRGVLTGSGDIVLVPDPTTFRRLPWSQKSGWMLCDVAKIDASPIDFAPRTVLRRAVSALADAGFEMVTGLEIEFHVFAVRDPRSAPGQAGMPAEPPEVTMLTRNYELLAEARYDALEEVMDAIRRAAQALGLRVRAMEAEFGPSQVEFALEPGSTIEQADAMVLFRSMTKQLCARRGLHATFMCKPNLPNCAASGWHLHQSVVERATGTNVFVPSTSGGEMTQAASAWIAGLLEHARECCALTTPTVNGYRRYQAYQLAPNRIQWAYDNRGAMVRALLRPGDPASRIENRVAEPAANPYYALASQIVAGLSGLSRKRIAPPPVESPYDNDATVLPSSLIEALAAFETGSLFSSALGNEFVAYYARLKHAEWERFIGTLSAWEHEEYFSTL